MSIYESVVDLVGSVPDGLEPTVYVLSVVVLVFLLSSAFSFIGSVFKRVSEL